jgi:uncharacterized SAM-binding protein YcdF (DUF218 family)
MLSFNGFRTRVLGLLSKLHGDHIPPSFAFIGLDGAAMLLLANVIIIATGGLALVFWFGKVYRVARSAPSSTSHGGCRVVLGERLRGGIPSDKFEGRLARALALGGPGRILIAGGPPGAVLSEARVGRDWLIAHGATPEDVEVEESSQNTLENLTQVRRIFGSDGGDGIVIISSRYHLARCQAIATGLGLTHKICASEDNLGFDLYNIKRMLIEAYFMNWYFVGKTWATLTDNRKMLGRIQ